MSAQDRLRVLKVIWMAMVGGVLAYTGVVFYLVSSGVVDVALFGPEVMNVVGAVVLVQLVGTVALRRRLLATFPDDATPVERLGRYQNLTIVALALMEGGGLVVISFALMSGAATWILAGGGAAAVLMLLARPSEDDLGDR